MNRRLFLSMFAAPYLGKILPARAVPAAWIRYDFGPGEDVIIKRMPFITEGVDEDLELTRLYAKMLKERE